MGNPGTKYLIAVALELTSLAGVEATIGPICRLGCVQETSQSRKTTIARGGERLVGAVSDPYADPGLCLTQNSGSDATQQRPLLRTSSSGSTLESHLEQHLAENTPCEAN